MNSRPEARSAHLELRPWSLADLDALAALTADPLVMKGVGTGATLDRATTLRWIESHLRSYARFGYGCWAVVERESGDVIGWGGLSHSPNTPEPPLVEILFALSPNFWGRGLGTELVGEIVAAAWRRPQLEEILATLDPDNAASVKALEKNGFIHVQTEVGDDGLPSAWYGLLRPGVE
ncbi:GNAT family N-acetyltransferase [Niveibacterium terrae]|uniref:GNAT family N-acetyltransferase n=1 Tax=Niveibacterium terrae TaxID=3373598 RepID=UPI003A8FF6CA